LNALLKPIREKFNCAALRKLTQRAYPSDEKNGTQSKRTPSKKRNQPLPLEIWRCDFRVGRITKITPHPKNKKWWVLQVDCKEQRGARTAIGGFAEAIPASELKDRLVVVLCNMQASNFGGVKSHAVILGASDGKTVELVDPPADCAVGERISFKQYTHKGQPDAVLKKKKKVFQKISADLCTDAQCRATYKGDPFMTSKGPCVVKSLKNAHIH